jgi:hypothetical protein
VSKQWLIDASISEETLAFVPYDELTGDILIGMTMLGSIPQGDELVGVCHPDGDEAAAAWVSENGDRISEFKASHV